MYNYKSVMKMKNVFLAALFCLLLASCSEKDEIPVEPDLVSDQVRRITSIDITGSWIDTTVYAESSYRLTCEYDSKRRLSELTFTTFDKNGTGFKEVFNVSYRDQAIDVCRLHDVRKDGVVIGYDTTSVLAYTLSDKNLIDRIDERYSRRDNYQYAYQVSEYENGYFNKGVYWMSEDPLIIENTSHYVNGILDSYRMTMQLAEDWSSYSYEEYTWSYTTMENKLKIPGQVLFGVFWYSFLNQINSSLFLDPFFYQMGYYGKQLPYWEKSGKSQVFDVTKNEVILNESGVYDYSFQYEFDDEGYPTTMKVTLGFCSTSTMAEFVFHFTYD